MRIKINLNYVLLKNKTSLSQFLTKNNISTYEGLVAYCKNRNMNPVEKQAFNDAVGSSKAAEKKEKSIDEEKPKTETKKRNTRRTASKTQAKKSSRPSTKKVKTS